MVGTSERGGRHYTAAVSREMSMSARRPLRLQGLRFLLFGRLVPASFFSVLGYLQFLHLLRSASSLRRPISVPEVLTGPLPSALYLLFCVIPVFIYIGRPAPRARDGRWLPRVAALTGTLMLLVVGALPQGELLYSVPAAGVGVASALQGVAFAVAVYGLLHLRRSLSIIPEARRLVTGGPYRVVRHPLYAAEILAAVAYVGSSPALLRVVVLVPFVLVQLLRARFEERLLTANYPAYGQYAATTRRLLPGVW